MGAESIAGGFIPIDVGLVVHAWTACQARPLGIGDFRAWLATHEMASRRKGVRESAIPFFGVAELARLTGTTERTAAASIRRLVGAGLLSWSETAIDFPGNLCADLHKGPDDTIGGGRGPVALPRRLVRWLARGARASVIATAIGAVCRCLSRRRDGWGSRGRFKASWIATTFGIAERHARAARAELVALGWLAPDPADDRQAAWNRWGRAFLVALDWQVPCGDRPTPPADPGARSSYPDLQPGPSPERRANPDPAGRGPAGASLVKEARQASGPDLRDTRPADLEDPARVVELHRQAVEAGWTTASEADRLRVLAAAEHARKVGTSNPPGLFRAIVQGRRWGLLTQRDEDTAARRSRERQRPSENLASAEARSGKFAEITASVVRSPYGAERTGREPTALGGLLVRILQSGKIPDRPS
jgi:hypothetical protein